LKRLAHNTAVFATIFLSQKKRSTPYTPVNQLTMNVMNILSLLVTLSILSFQCIQVHGAKKGIVVEQQQDSGEEDVFKLEQKQAVTTVANLAADVNAQEAEFFDDAWMQAFNSVYTGIDDLTAIAVEMKDHKKRRKGGNKRNLRVLYFNFFDFYVRITFQCGPLCIDERRRDLEKKHTKTDKEQAALHHAFERTLCESLGQGPYDVFSNASDCQISFVDE
jgi:hypothetical protein